LKETGSDVLEHPTNKRHRLKKNTSFNLKPLGS